MQKKQKNLPRSKVAIDTKSHEVDHLLTDCPYLIFNSRFWRNLSVYSWESQPFFPTARRIHGLSPNRQSRKWRL